MKKILLLSLISIIPFSNVNAKSKRKKANEQRIADSLYRVANQKEIDRIIAETSIPVPVTENKDTNYFRATPKSTGTSNYGPVHVKGYYRSNGTYVSPHYRSSPSSYRRR